MRLPILAAAAWLALAGAASAMSYSLVDFDDGRCGRRCGGAIVAQGTIELNETERLMSFLQGLNRETVPAVLLLQSPGGNLYGALRLGLLLRSLNMRTAVAAARSGQGGELVLQPSTCASACVFLLMAGRDRIVPEGSRIIVHQARRAGPTTRDALGGGSIDPRIDRGPILATMQTYSRIMGVDPALMLLAESVPHESGYVLSRAEIQRFRLATRAGKRAAPKRRRS